MTASSKSRFPQEPADISRAPEAQNFSALPTHERGLEAAQANTHKKLSVFDLLG